MNEVTLFCDIDHTDDTRNAFQISRNRLKTHSITIEFHELYTQPDSD